MSRKRPIERCGQCGSVYKMEYIGLPDDPHAHHGDHHGYEEPKSFADYVKPEYWVPVKRRSRLQTRWLWRTDFRGLGPCRISSSGWSCIDLVPAILIYLICHS